MGTLDARTERQTLRREIIAGVTDCPLTPAEAAAFLGIAESSLRSTDIPRIEFFGPKYLKSECLKYLIARLPYRIELEKAG